MTRPEPGYRAPDGFHFEAAPNPGWRADKTRLCRRSFARQRPCGKPSVAALNRGLRTKYRGTVDCWWGYCAEHMYGNWIEDGQVMHWQLVADEVTQ